MLGRNILKKSMYCILKSLINVTVLLSPGCLVCCVAVILEVRAYCSPQCPVVMSGRPWMGEVQSRRMSQ